MRDPSRAPAGAEGTRWIRQVRTHLREPAVLAFLAVAFFISAVGQAVADAYTHENSVVTTAILSVLGSLFLTVAIVIAARRHDQGRRSRRPPGRNAR